MRIEDLRAWHWMLIGIIAGLLFGVVHRAAGPWFDTDDLPTLSAPAFQSRINGRLTANPLARFLGQSRQHDSLLKDLVIHPPVPGDPSKSNWITGKMFEIVTRPTDPSRPQGPTAYYELWSPFKCRAPIPFKATVGAPGVYPGVSAYLAAIQKKVDPQITFRYAWWEQSTPTLLMPAGAGLLIIGFAWPLTIMLLQGGRMARPRRTRSVRLPPGRKATAAAARDNTAGDLQLAALNDQLEASLAAGASAHDAPTASAPDSAPAVKPLSADPFCGAIAAAEEEAAKEYGGEFYPVAKPKHHS